MRLTWKDTLATVAAGVNVAVYVAFTQGADLPIVGDVRGATGTILLLGLVGGCMLSAAPEAYERQGPYTVCQVSPRTPTALRSSPSPRTFWTS
ncbi:hypothetical protein [Nonomuraea rubra]|uniref:hypothetical protein n=1 Tax=Nonomuraea rubra TaxID=46180 RepID=UPI0033BFEC2C